MDTFILGFHSRLGANSPIAYLTQWDIQSIILLMGLEFDTIYEYGGYHISIGQSMEQHTTGNEPIDNKEILINIYYNGALLRIYDLQYQHIASQLWCHHDGRLSLDMTHDDRAQRITCYCEICTHQKQILRKPPRKLSCGQRYWYLIDQELSSNKLSLTSVMLRIASVKKV